jgi:hypothetical protein
MTLLLQAALYLQTLLARSADVAGAAFANWPN